MDQKILVNFQNFLIAARDSGYKSTASALAELIDNSVEAGATRIRIEINKVNDVDCENYEVLVIDNGKGMTKEELNLALQFGGSTRFNSRSKLGRYGMGLPCSSLSQCKRVEVYSWQKNGKYLFNCLDSDEIADMRTPCLPKPKTMKRVPIFAKSKSGTIVLWKKCDRISYKYLKNLIKSIHFELGRIFRYYIWNGVVITICGEKVVPFDPLYLLNEVNLKGALQYGKDLLYEIRVPGHVDKLSKIKVRFIELPVQKWAKFSNDIKKQNRITKNAGVSILRSGREIDYGWFFMGNKRKENYDDWWRCEISFEPELDEVFGVTHIKQGIKETEYINNILAPDLEQIAHTLNNKVRNKFIDFKKVQPKVYSKKILERNDVYIDSIRKSNIQNNRYTQNFDVKGLEYEILLKDLKNDMFFDVREKHDKLLLFVNTKHIFYDKVFKVLHAKQVKNISSFMKMLEIVIFAAARSEFSFSTRKDNQIIMDFKKRWSSNIKAFMN